MLGTYPDSVDVLLATLASPMTAPVGVNSPDCVATATAPSCF